jgi:hypothetical protein
MPRIDWPVIQSDIRCVTIQLEVALAILVTRLVERLELTEKELVQIAVVRLDVVGDRRWRHNPALGRT